MQQIPPEYMNFESQTPPRTPRNRRSGAVTLIAILVLILAALVILNESLLRITKVAVVGNRTVSWDDVVTQAGLNRATGYFSVNETKIAQGINANRYLVYERLEKVFPDTLTIYVRERAPVVKVQEMGAVYYLDEEGMVLERYDRLLTGQGANDSLMIVTGLKPKEMRVGRQMVAGTAAHMEAFRSLIQELTLQGYVNQISELNVNDPDNLYLITRDGYTAHLGNGENLRAKIGTVRAVVEKLREMEKKGGMLEAAVPGEAVYTPENQ